MEHGLRQVEVFVKGPGWRGRDPRPAGCRPQRPQHPRRHAHPPQRLPPPKRRRVRRQEIWLDTPAPRSRSADASASTSSRTRRAARPSRSGRTRVSTAAPAAPSRRSTRCSSRRSRRPSTSTACWSASSRTSTRRPPTPRATSSWWSPRAVATCRPTATGEWSATIGVIPVDSIFSPVRRVTFTVEPTREQSTEFDRLVLDIETDGSISAREALASAGATLHAGGPGRGDERRAPGPRLRLEVSGTWAAARPEPRPAHRGPRPLRASPQLPQAGPDQHRRRAGPQKTEDDLLAITNFGQKSLDEVIQKLDERGLSLRTRDVGGTVLVGTRRCLPRRRRVAASAVSRPPEGR